MMSKILKVTIEYDDKTVEVDGPEAEKWERHNQSLASLAYVHRMNPFDSDPVKWNRQAKKVDAVALLQREGLLGPENVERGRSDGWEG